MKDEEQHHRSLENKQAFFLAVFFKALFDKDQTVHRMPGKATKEWVGFSSGSDVLRDQSSGKALFRVLRVSTPTL